MPKNLHVDVNCLARDEHRQAGLRVIEARVSAGAPKGSARLALLIKFSRWSWDRDWEVKFNFNPELAAAGVADLANALRLCLLALPKDHTAPKRAVLRRLKRILKGALQHVNFLPESSTD
jgi:hypothetical protein